jgi:hypothetical protein
VNRSILFPALVFLLLLGLLFLLSGQLSRFSIPRAMPESWRASDRAALEEETVANQQTAIQDDLQPALSSALIENRRRFSGGGLFPDPAELKDPVNDERAHPFTIAGLDQIAGKQGGESSRPKNQVRVTEYRTRVNLARRIREPRFFERRLGHSATGPSWRKIRSDIRRVEKRITRWFHPTWRRGGRYALSP